MAVKELDGELRKSITPFFDFPYKKDRTEADIIRTADRVFNSLRRNISDVPFFYLDNYDVDSNLTVNNENNYIYLLNACQDLRVVPVISIDRRPEHMQAVCEAKRSGQLKSDIVALRFVRADFMSYDTVTEDINDILGDTIGMFRKLDLILDCRYCLNLDLNTLASEVSSFIQSFVEQYSVRNVIVTGSSIPPSISTIISANNETEVERAELDIFQQVNDENDSDFDIVLGDYGIVSPEFSDIDIVPEAMLNVTAPKIIYTFDNRHFVIRGGAIKTHKRGFHQYNDMARIVVNKSFYRGARYSYGDNYMYEKSCSLGKNVTPGAIIKPTTNLHLTYMLKDCIPNILSY